jgi:hypothetical protein
MKKKVKSEGTNRNENSEMELALEDFVIYQVLAYRKQT